MNFTGNDSSSNTVNLRIQDISATITITITTMTHVLKTMTCPIPGGAPRDAMGNHWLNDFLFKKGQFHGAKDNFGTDVRTDNKRSARRGSEPSHRTTTHSFTFDSILP